MSSYHIYASLHEGRPSLQIVDADSRRTCLDWEISTDQHSADDIHALFRKLLLLTCRQKLRERLERQQNEEETRTD
jgi:hypothetical protein